jgi:hypothetical protein
MITGIIPLLLLLAFGGGIALAGRFCKTPVSQFFVGILLGFGFICVILGVAFAGCMLLLSKSDFR